MKSTQNPPHQIETQLEEEDPMPNMGKPRHGEFTTLHNKPCRSLQLGPLHTFQSVKKQESLLRIKAVVSKLLGHLLQQQSRLSSNLDVKLATSLESCEEQGVGLMF